MGGGPEDGFVGMVLGGPWVVVVVVVVAVGGVAFVVVSAISGGAVCRGGPERVGSTVSDALDAVVVNAVMVDDVDI